MSAGKGSKPRPVDPKVYAANFDQIRWVGRGLRTRRLEYIDKIVANLDAADPRDIIDERKLRAFYSGLSSQPSALRSALAEN